MSFAFVTRESRRDALITLGTHITMSLLIFCLILILVLHLVLLMLCLTSFMDLTIAHIVLVHEKTSLNRDALVTTHVLIVVIVSHVAMVFPLKGLTLI
jgi:hypothetical protein